MSFEISTADQAKFFQIFQQSNPQNDKLSGDSVRALFTQSGLPLAQLKEIWDVSDIDGDGNLDFDEFCVSMKLISLLLAKQIHSIPSILPPSLVPLSKRTILSHVQSFSPNTGSPRTDLGVHGLGLGYSANSMAVQPFYSSFVQLSNGKDHITFFQVNSLLQNSNILADQILTAWNLVNIRSQDQINFSQFSVFMQLLNTVRNGGYLPQVLSEKDRITIYDSLTEQPKKQSLSDISGSPNSFKGKTGVYDNYTPSSKLAESYMSRKKSHSPVVKKSQVSSMGISSTKSPLSQQSQLEPSINTTDSSFDNSTDANRSQESQISRYVADPKSVSNPSTNAELQQLYSYKHSMKIGLDLFVNTLLNNCAELANSTTATKNSEIINPAEFTALLNSQISELNSICSILELEQHQVAEFINTV